jgi:hypothetical protein
MSDKPWLRLSRHQQESRNKAARVVSAQRADPGLSLGAAARREGIFPDTVLTNFGRWYTRDSSGQLRPVARDEEPFLMPVYSTRGIVDVEVPDSDARSLVGRHMGAVLEFRDTGRTAQLAPFTGQRVGGATLETDPDRLLPLVWQGPDFLELYRI